MIPFDLEKALAGEKVITKSGKEVTQIHRFNITSRYSVCAVIEGDLWHYDDDGICETPIMNLEMAPKEIVRFIQVSDEEYGLGVHSPDLIGAMNITDDISFKLKSICKITIVDGEIVSFKTVKKY